MTRPIIHEYNVTTGESIEREMDDKEFETWLKTNEAIEARQVAEQAEAQAKAEAKASALAKLAALGLTEEEAKAIAG